MKKEIDYLDLRMYKRSVYGSLTPSNNEIQIMDFVSDTLDTKYEPINLETMNINMAIEKGIKSLTVFNRKYINKVNKIEFYTYDDLPANDLRTIISYNVLDSNKIKRGKVLEIKVPSETSELSPIWIGHELIHSLKDTNYYEYILIDIASEVLPIFYEMLVSNTLFKDLHDKWKEYRLSFLSNHKDIYRQLEDKSKIDNRYNLIRYEYGQYLTSYYYALNLFHLYKQNPKIITKNINKVLTQKMTTLDLLKKFNIYNIDKEHVNIYKFEHSKL